MKDWAQFFAALATSPTAAWRTLATLVVGGHILWACGWLPGISGFAMAGELEVVAEKLEAIETKQNIALRIALAEEICRLYTLRAENAGNVSLWQTLNDTFVARQEDYRAVNNGNEYPVAQCSAPR